MVSRQESVSIEHTEMRTVNSDCGTEQSVELVHDHRGVRIVVIGEIGELRNALQSASRDELWQWHVFPTLDAFLAAPRHPRTVVIPVIDSFTIASLALIRHLAVLFDLPVVVFGLERHPVMIRAALEAGADDVIATPAPIEEILVRLRAIVRVAFSGGDVCNEHATYRLDEAGRSVSLEGGPAIDLSLAEYRVLKALLTGSDHPVPREQLAAQIAPFTRSRGTGMLDITISRLRRKLGAQRVRTICGIGYQLVDERHRVVSMEQPTPSIGN